MPEKTEIETLPNGQTFEMVPVAGGAFHMGDKEANWAEPVHKVTLPAFYLGKYPVSGIRIFLFCQGYR